jgi:glycine/D-amino acid oxidase-like deaminating enzyme/nitrite reductase/ring-hydroxylating ferredoxin subunit
MPSDSGHTTSLWMATADVPTYPPLSQDAKADVCVIGAGIAGLSTAYLLVQAGKSLVILDDGAIGGGETGRTTAHLSNEMDDRYLEIERVHGEDGARAAAESHTAAIDKIEEIVGAEEIDCDFERVDGYLFLARDDSDNTLVQELEAAHRAGLTAVEPLERVPLPSFDTGPCLRFPNQAQLHPLKYLSGLARAIVRGGGRIHTGSHVEGIDGEGPVTVTTKDMAKVTAGKLVVCTNSPINDWVKIHAKQAPYRTYVVGARIPRGSVPRALYWDTADPYHYVRLQPDEQDSEHFEVLVAGGEDHKTGQADDMAERFRCLEAWTRERFPMARRFVYHWSGQVMEPVDYMAFIGKNPGSDNIYVATGDSGQGMTHGTIAGMLITDLILGRRNPWATLYDPSRIPLSLSAVREFAKENINVAVQYTEFVRPLDAISPDEVAPGQGAVIRRDARPIAVYRDEAGAVHEYSAVCPHLKCIVHWNSLEKSWDCPCHGSRFDAYGSVLNGPATTPLEPVEQEHSAGR